MVRKVLVVALTASVTAASSLAAAVAAPRPAPARRAQQQQTPASVQTPQMFGFSLGEERRWIVESEAFGFEPGELVLWIMRLESIDRQTSRTIGHFRLAHEARRFSRRNNILNPAEMDVTVTVTDLWVNQSGFPLRVRHGEDRAGTVARSGNVDVRWHEARLRVFDAAAIGYRDFALHVPGAGDIDTERPQGVFLSSAVNPGLLALPFALALEEPDLGTRFVAFDPSPLIDPSWVRVDAPDASVGPGGAAFGSSRRPPTPLQLSERSLRRTTLTIGALEETRIGGVTTQAHRIDLSSGGDVWIAPGGKLLRINIVMRRMNAWIRLLRPSEY